MVLILCPGADIAQLSEIQRKSDDESDDTAQWWLGTNAALCVARRARSRARAGGRSQIVDV
jgi:hypothetical protein